jgi:hypothetical protein
LAASVIKPFGVAVLLVELTTLPFAFATFELTTTAVFELVILALDMAVLVLELLLFPVVLVALPGQPANPKTAKLNKNVSEKNFIFTPLVFDKIKKLLRISD